MLKTVARHRRRVDAIKALEQAAQAQAADRRIVTQAQTVRQLRDELELTEAHLQAARREADELKRKLRESSAELARQAHANQELRRELDEALARLEKVRMALVAG